MLKKAKVSPMDAKKNAQKDTCCEIMWYCDKLA